MPIYEYQCANCQHELEHLQKISDAPLVTCPACGADSLSKLVSAPSFRLSGSGWYETDFKTDKDKKKNLAGDAGKSSGASTAETKKSNVKPDSGAKSSSGSNTKKAAS